jgi:hypothetical protein
MLNNTRQNNLIEYLSLSYQIFVASITFFIPLIFILFTYGIFEFYFTKKIKISFFSTACIIRQLVKKTELDKFDDNQLVSKSECTFKELYRYLYHYYIQYFHKRID